MNLLLARIGKSATAVNDKWVPSLELKVPPIEWFLYAYVHSPAASSQICRRHPRRRLVRMVLLCNLITTSDSLRTDAVCLKMS